MNSLPKTVTRYSATEPPIVHSRSNKFSQLNVNVFSSRRKVVTQVTVTGRRARRYLEVERTMVTIKREYKLPIICLINGNSRNGFPISSTLISHKLSNGCN